MVKGADRFKEKSRELYKYRLCLKNRDLSSLSSYSYDRFAGPTPGGVFGYVYTCDIALTVMYSIYLACIGCFLCFALALMCRRGCGDSFGDTDKYGKNM